MVNLPNTVGNAEGGDSIAGGIKEGTLFAAATGEKIEVNNLDGDCPVRIVNDFAEVFANSEFTCSYYDPN